MNLKDRTVVITGGNKGIGRAVALAFAEDSSRICISGRDANALADTKAEIEATGARCEALVCDVSDTDQVNRFARDAERAFGPAEVLVNNAGFSEGCTFVDISEDLWLEHLDVNLTATFRVTAAFLPAMLKRGSGRIINIGSLAGRMGSAGHAAYISSKHGLVGLTRALASEYAATGLTVNCICPGYTRTDMLERAYENIGRQYSVTSTQARQYVLETNPQKRLIEPDEIAALAVFLASKGARGINGQSINICGGIRND